jgi:hypothetical protein
MIIFQRVNVVTFLPIVLISYLVGKVHYVSMSQKVIFLLQDTNFPILNKLACNLFPLSFNSLPRILRYRDYAYGYKDCLQNHSERYLAPKVVDYVSRFFVNVINIRRKLNLSLAKTFEYAQMGKVSLFVSGLPLTENVYYFHTSLKSYMFRSQGVKGAEIFYHFYIPIDDFIDFLVKVSSKFPLLLSRKKIRPLTVEKQKTLKSMSARTAIFYHNSVQYGPLFNKSQYFSNDIHSQLHKGNLICFVLERITSCCGDSIDDQIQLIDIAPNYKLIDGLLNVLFLLKGVLRVRSLNSFKGLLFLISFHSKYRSWCRVLENYPSLVNVIIDYDILFPSSLSLALESKGIRTLALQERPAMSFSFIYPVIAHTYFFSGGIYTKQGISNFNFCYEDAVNFGSWRTSFFLQNKLPKIGEVNLISFGNNNFSDFESSICCLGWFTDQESNNSHPVLNRDASLEYFLRIKLLAVDFPHIAIVLRMKFLSESDRSVINEYFSDINNFFLCDDYSVPLVSYSLCKNADIIISVQTSLADECLAYGKKVILIDSTHNLSGMIKDVYPEDFHFASASNYNQIKSLVTRCLNGDQTLSAHYQQLSYKLAGQADLKLPNAISQAIEAHFQ